MPSEDICFCLNDCRIMSCPRNKQNIRMHNIPHAFSYLLGTNLCPLSDSTDEDSDPDDNREERGQ